MNILLTGGAGFIGSHCLDLFKRQGWQVTVVDDFSSGNPDNISAHQDVQIIRKNVLALISDDFKERFDAIVHLAALPSVKASWETPLAAHERTLTSTIKIVEIARDLKVPRIVWASSAAVYGKPSGLPIHETHPRSPLSPYGLQKSVAEDYLSLFSGYFGFSALNLRLFNVYGSRQDPRSPYSGVISLLLEASRSKSDFWIEGDGSQTRDFIHVSDVVRAIAEAVKMPSVTGSQAINVGSGKPISLNELIEIVRTHAGDITIKNRDARAGDIRHSVADISLMQELLGIADTISLNDGIKLLVQK